MTVSKYIIDLLKTYKGIEVDTNHVSDGADQYGLFKSPARSVKTYISGEYEITENYQFLARQSNVSKSERKDADEWIEELAYWADDLGYVYDFPQLDNNRKVIGLSLTGNPYPMESDERDSLFQMSLSITYMRGREEQ